MKTFRIICFILLSTGNIVSTIACWDFVSVKSKGGMQSKNDRILFGNRIFDHVG